MHSYWRPVTEFGRRRLATRPQRSRGWPERRRVLFLDGHLLYLAVTEPECPSSRCLVFFGDCEKNTDDAARRETQSVWQGMIPDTALYDVVAAGWWWWYYNSESHAYEQVLFLQVQLLLISWMERRGETRRGEARRFTVCVCYHAAIQVPNCPCKSNERCWGLCSSTAYRPQPAPTAESSVQLEIGQKPQVRLLGLREVRVRHGLGSSQRSGTRCLFARLAGSFLLYQCRFACHNPWFLVPIDGWVPSPPPTHGAASGQGREPSKWVLFLAKLKFNPR